MLSVAVLTYSTRPRGSVVHAACLVEALAHRGVDVTLYALGKGEPFFRKLRAEVRLLPAAGAPADPEALIRQRLAEVERGLRELWARHDLYHAEDCLMASALLSMSAPRPRPLVRTVHHVERFTNPYLADCQRRSIQEAELVLSVSRATARDVSETFGRASPVIHNGVERERFAGGRGVAARETRLGIEPGARVVLSVGGVEPRKNSLRSLEAMARVLGEFRDVRWVIAGGASLWEHADERRSFAERLAELPESLRDRVEELGPVDDDVLTWLYRRSEVVLAASLQEGWGLSVIEAMAAGTPVVCPEGAPFDEFTDERTAELVDPLSVGSIAAGVTRLLSDPELRFRRSLAAGAVAERFSWERSAELHERAYRRLVEPRAPRAAAPDSLQEL